MYLLMSDRFDEQLEKRLKYNAIIECQELSDYFQLHPVKVLEKTGKGYQTTYKTDFGLFRVATDMFADGRRILLAYPLDKAGDNYILVDDDGKIGLWLAKTRDLMLMDDWTGPYYIFTTGTLRKGASLCYAYYYYKPCDSDKYYVSRMSFSNDFCNTAEMKAKMFKKYINEKKGRILDNIAFWHNIKLRYRDTEKCWRYVKLQYKKAKAILRREIERGLLAKNLTVQGLKQAGWQYYKDCELLEPPEPFFYHRYAVIVQVFRFTKVLINANNFKLKIPISLLPATVQNIIQKSAGERCTVSVADGRIVKYLKFIPELLKVKLEKIPYFKWAINKVFEEIEKTLEGN